MTNMISVLFSDPLSGWLLLGDVVATLIVGLGIVLEVPENPNLREKIAVALVVIGVVGETISSVWLFSHDSAVMLAQQARIIQLSPRELSLDQRIKIAAACENFKATVVVTSTSGDAEGSRLASQIIETLGMTQGIKAIDQRGGFLLSGAFFGVHVDGPKRTSSLVNCLTKAFRDIGGLTIEKNPRPFPYAATNMEVVVDMKPID